MDGRKKIILEENEFWNEYNLVEMHMTNNGKYLLTLASKWEDSVFEYGIQVYDREANVWIEHPEEIRDLKFTASYQVCLAEEKNLAAVYEEEKKQISIIDLEKNCIWKQIPFNGKTHFRIQFVQNDTALMLWSDEGYLKLWNLEKEEIVMEGSQRFSSISEIYTCEEENLLFIRGIDAESRNKYLSGMWMTWIYRLEEDCFYPYVQIFNGTYDADAKRIGGISSGSDALYWFELYTLDDLLEWGREVVGDAQLSEADKVKYFIED